MLAHFAKGVGLEGATVLSLDSLGSLTAFRVRLRPLLGRGRFEGIPGVSLVPPSTPG